WRLSKKRIAAPSNFSPIKKRGGNELCLHHNPRQNALSPAFVEGAGVLFSEGSIAKHDLFRGPAVPAPRARPGSFSGMAQALSRASLAGTLWREIRASDVLRTGAPILASAFSRAIMASEVEPTGAPILASAQASSASLV